MTDNNKDGPIFLAFALGLVIGVWVIVGSDMLGWGGWHKGNPKVELCQRASLKGTEIVQGKPYIHMYRGKTGTLCVRVPTR